MTLDGLVTWLIDLVKSIFIAIWDFIKDIFLAILDGILIVVASLLAALPSPSFISQSDWLAALLSPLPPFALFVIGNLRIPEALAIIASGVSFRLLRKLATLFQW